MLHTSVIRMSLKSCGYWLSRVGGAEVGMWGWWTIQVVRSTHIYSCIHICSCVRLAMHLFIEFLITLRCPIFFILQLEFAHDLWFVNASEVFGFSEYLPFGIKLRSLTYLLQCILIINVPLIQVYRCGDAHDSDHSWHYGINYGHVVSLLGVYLRSYLRGLRLKVDIFRYRLWWRWLRIILCGILLCCICRSGLIASLVIWQSNISGNCLILGFIRRRGYCIVDW